MPNFIEPIGITRMHKRFFVPEIETPDEPFFPFSPDTAVVYALGIADPSFLLKGIMLHHVWITQGTETRLIDGFLPHDYVRAITETRALDNPPSELS
ncbi:hypothetical protein HY948_01905 [Candidatus Gottesmanbacteria bacterium]|nr:hypothetical protein [Candidatus Gottesmanbacteria bacterium]